MFKLNFFKKKQGLVNPARKNKGAIKEFLAKMSRGLMLPIAMLPIAGIFNGVGSAIVTNAGANEALRVFGQVIQIPGAVVFNNLPVLFAIAIAITFTQDAGTAGLSAFLGWIIFNAVQSAFIFTRKDDAGAITAYDFLFYHFSDQNNNWLELSWFSAIFTTNVGIQSLSTSVFGGLIIGFIVAILYNKFKNIQLPAVIGFFSGVRFIPIITFLSCLVLGLGFSIIWPIIGIGLCYVGIGLGVMSEKAAGFNSFIYGFVNRMLLPFGLHHAINIPLWQTAIGGQISFDNATLDSTNPEVFGMLINGTFKNVIEVNGAVVTNWRQFIEQFASSYLKADGVNVQGDINCWSFMNTLVGTKVTFADQTTATVTFQMLTDTFNKLQAGKNYVNPGQYMDGTYPIMMFALPAAAVAMIMAAPKGENRKMALSVIISAAFASFLTGITEPIEFTFLFLVPWLYYGFHAFFCGFSYWMLNLWHAHLGMTFSTGLIDYAIYGILPDALGADAGSWKVIILGLCYIPVYYLVFYFVITKFNVPTPGRGENIKLFTKADLSNKKASSNQNNPMQELAMAVIAAYGGKQNIKNVDACITKLRVQVVDQSKVSKEQLLKLGAKGVMKPSPQSVYAVFGTQADRIKNEMRELLK